MMIENPTMQSGHIKVVAVGYYGAANIGDELLLGLLAREVKTRGGELVALSINPEYTRAVHGIEAIDYFNLGAIGQALSDADLLVFGGGGIFQDHHPFHIEALYDPTENDIAAYARIFYMARQYGVRTVIWAHGVGPLRSPAARDLTCDVFTHADHVSVRDSDSKTLLHDIGVQREILVGADPGWTFVCDRQPQVDVSDKLAPLGMKKKLAVIVRAWEFNRNWEGKLVDALNETLDDSWSIVWLGFQWSAGHHDSFTDRSFLEQLRQEVNPRIESVIIDQITPGEVFSILGECDAAFSMRLHGSILALRQSLPIAALEYDAKMAHAHEMAGLPASLRLQLDSDTDQFAATLRQLTKHDGEPWIIAKERLDELNASAGVHATVLDQAFEAARSSANTVQRHWQSQKFDWVSTWLEQLIWQKDGAVRLNKKALDLLHYRDAQLAQKDMRIAEVERDLALAHENLAYRDAQLGQKDTRISEVESDLAVAHQNLAAAKTAMTHAAQEHETHAAALEDAARGVAQEHADKIASLEATIRELEQRLAESQADVQRVLLDRDRIEREQFQLRAKHPRLFALLKIPPREKLDEAPITPTTSRSAMLFRRFMSAPQSYMSRAVYILRNGGLRALVSAARRHYRYQHAQQQVQQSIAEVVARDATADDALRWFRAAAKLQRAELVVISAYPYNRAGAGHRYAQLTTAALGAGHRVIYLVAARSSDAQERSDALQSGIPGLIHAYIDPTKLEETFGQVSESAKLIIGVPDERVMPFFKFARDRGLETIIDISQKWQHDEQAQNLLETLVTDADRCTVGMPVLASAVPQQIRNKVEHLPGAAVHTIFDAYKQYARPGDMPPKHLSIALFYSVNGLDAVDYPLLQETAESNRNVTFCVIADGELPSGLPDNVVMLGMRQATEVAAYIAHADFLFFPLGADALSSADATAGVYAALHQRKPVVCSMDLGVGTSPLLHVCTDISSFSAQCATLAAGQSTTTVDDAFIAENSWLSRVEQLCPPAPRHDVSVVILIHNNAGIIARCLQTLLQHCSSYVSEVIVVDNASSDGGAELVEREFPNVKLVRNPQNGCSSGRNLGVQHCTGKYIAFFDSDQWFVGGSGFGEALHVLENDASVGVIGWNAGWFDATRTDLGGMIADYCPNRAMNAVAIRDGYRADIGFLGTSGLFMRRRTFDATRGFDTFYDPTCFEDTDLCFQVKALGMKVTYRDLSGIRHQPHQTTGANSGSEAYRKLFLRNANYFKEKWRDYPHFYLDYVD
ncbi:polysaccharide pyruvyl transferase family protein [Burkholderia multivorans]|uniref:polysaccharide pyruvyl transferase family protein n=1 Tax=Burkholderia multivorans TaxID=87883 RepID=UPI0021DADA2A|nr:polysaccharide pyruvyl transferase family protein [Burkholderia multivorans]UXZ61874.1 polysaccharide pyruvyl transferase family protein [Burkholderia multivorans]